MTLCYIQYAKLMIMLQYPKCLFIDVVILRIVLMHVHTVLVIIIIVTAYNVMLS